MSYYELELRIQWTDPGKYVIAGRCINPDQDSETELIDREAIAIDHAALRAVADDPDKYGAASSQMIFGSAPVQEAYGRARDASGTRDGLRIRLHIQKGAPELHALRWELMHEPGKTARRFLERAHLVLPLSECGRIARGGAAENPDQVQVLVAVANPTDVKTRWQHPPIEVEAEYKRAEEAVVPRNGVGQRLITTRRLPGRVSIYDLISSLRDNYAEVLYLVAHGSITADGAPHLLLEGEGGDGEIVAGEELVERLVASGQLPRLIVLASCKSAGGQGTPGLVALAPRLAQAGVPHVLAMQGEVSIESMRKFMPRFFKELASHGQIDRAVAAARAEILDAPDWWMPVLYTHSRRGLVWPPRSMDVRSFQGWNSVVMSLAERSVLSRCWAPAWSNRSSGRRAIWRGPGRTATRFRWPENRDDLAQVAQHLAYQNDAFFVLGSIRAYVTRYLRKRFQDKLPKELLEARVEKGLVDRMISHIGKDLRASNPNEVHTMLAKMPVPIYINANRDNLLFDALLEQGKRPRMNVCTWATDEQPGQQLDPNYVPSVDEPLVFHVFGNFKYPDDLIVTEDDYFEFLMGVTRNETREAARIPPAVTAAIANSGWLMLGFQVDDWDFRVVLSSVLRQPGRRMGLNRRTSVAIQMNLTDEGVAFARTFDYLDRYFSKNKEVSLFWSSPEAFVNELWVRYKQAMDADSGVKA